MRITYPAKGIVNARVLEWRIGEQAVIEAWIGDRRIWPDDSEAHSIRVTLPAEGTLDAAYWAHAMEAVKYGVSEDCWAKAMIGGKAYYLNESPDGSWPLDLTGNVISAETVGDLPVGAIGDKLEVRLKIPARTSARVMNGSADMLPALPGTIVHGGVAKGRKRVSSGIHMTVYDLPSEAVAYSKYFQQNGHKRGDFYFDFAHLGWTDGRVKTRLKTSLVQTDYGYAMLKYPSFEVSLELPVIAVS